LNHNGIFRSDNNGAIIELILPVALKGRRNQVMVVTQNIFLVYKGII
jgi:hypothetical protein